MTLETGVRLGPYEILSPLNVAGMGEVYRGRDHGHGRDVAIRVLRLSPWTFRAAMAFERRRPRLQRRLKGDVRAAAEVRHTDILDIYDVVADTRAVYIVSAPFEDEPSRAMLDRGGLAVEGSMGPRITIEVPSLSALLSRRRRLAWVAVFGLLVLFAAIALPAIRSVRRARQDAQTARVAVGEPTPSAMASSTAAGVLSADPPAEPVAPLLEATTEEGSIEEIVASDEVAVTSAEAEAEAEAEVPVREEASSEGEGVPPDGDAVRDVVSDVDVDGDPAIAEATASELPPPEPLPPEPSPPRDERDARSLITEAMSGPPVLPSPARDPPLQGGRTRLRALAGDLWLQVHGYQEAWQSYVTAAQQVGPVLRVLAGLARATARLNDAAAACEAFRSLVEEWGARQAEPPEIGEARAYLRRPACMTAGP